MATKDNQDELRLNRDLRLIINSLADVRNNWYRIGVQLGLPVSELDAIQCHDPSQALIEMLKKWFKMDTEHTWTAIVTALKSEDLQEGSLAAKITEEYITCTPESLQIAYPRSASVPSKPDSKDADISLIQRSTSEGVTAQQNSTLTLSACSAQQGLIPQKSSNHTGNSFQATSSEVSRLSSLDPEEPKRSSSLDLDVTSKEKPRVAVIPQTPHSPITATPDHSESVEADFDSNSSSAAGAVEKVSYRYLDMSGMSEGEKSALRGKLTNDYNYIVSEYSKLNRSIRKSLNDRQISPKQLADVLLELSAFSLRKTEKDNKPLLVEHLDEIEMAKDVFHVFKIIRPYGSFFDCSVIKHIVDSELCIDKDRETLQKYLEKLNAYCQRSIFECPHIATPEQSPKFRNLIIKMDDIIPGTYTLKAIDALCDRLAKELNVEGHTLRLCSVEDGCLQLTFQIPTFVKKDLFPLSKLQRELLKELHIHRIDCDGCQFLADHVLVSQTQMILENQPTSTDPLPIESASIPVAKLQGPSRYGYIHVDGVTIHKGYFTFYYYKPDGASSVHNVKIQLKHKTLGDSAGPIYEKEVDLSPRPEFVEKISLYAVLEIQDRAMIRHLKVFLRDDYMPDICRRLLPVLRWLSEGHLTPKLEGRFGRLPWRQNVHKYYDRVELQTDSDEFVHTAFDDPSAHFLTKISEEDVEKLNQNCCKRDGDIIDKFETYDFKLTSKIGKLDVRLKFIEGKPQIVTVKKFEHKVAIFDVLCLHRKYDMRVSLNTYESASPDTAIAKKFVSTVKLVKPGVIKFIPKAKDNEWTVAFLRHRKVDTLFYKRPKYVVTISNVGQLGIKAEDMDHDESIVINDTDYDSHSEAELHNLSWEVSFGHQIGLTPKESLVRFTRPEAIPQDVLSSIDSEQWTPEGVLGDFEKDSFMKMLEDINEIMSSPLHTS